MSDLRLDKDTTKTEERSAANVAVDELMALFSAVKGCDASLSVLPVLTIVEDTLRKTSAGTGTNRLTVEFDEKDTTQLKTFTLNGTTWHEGEKGVWISDLKESLVAKVTADKNGNLKIERENKEDGSTVVQDIKPNGEKRTVARDKANHVLFELVQDGAGKAVSYKSENGVVVQRGGGIDPPLLSTMNVNEDGNLVMQRANQTDVVLKPNGEQVISARGTEYDEKTRFSVTFYPPGRDAQMVEIKDPNESITTVKLDKNGNLVSARIRATGNDGKSGSWITQKDGLTYTNGRDTIPLKSAELDESGTIVMLDKSGTKKICVHPDGSTAEHSLIDAEKGLWKPTSLKFGNGGCVEYKWEKDGTLTDMFMQSLYTGDRIVHCQRSVGGTFSVYDGPNGKPGNMCFAVGGGVSAGIAVVSLSVGVGESLPHQDRLRGVAVNSRGEPTLFFLPGTVETVVLGTASRVSLSSSGSTELYRTDATNRRAIYSDRKGAFVKTDGRYFASLEESLLTQAKVFEEAVCQFTNEATKDARKVVDKGLGDMDILAPAGAMFDTGLKLIASSPVGAQVKKTVDDLKGETKKVAQGLPKPPELEAPEPPVAARPLSPHQRIVREQSVSEFLKDHLVNNTPGDLPNGTGKVDRETPRGQMTLQFEKGKVVSASLKRRDGSIAQLRSTPFGEVQEEFSGNGKLERATAPKGTSYKQVLLSEAANEKLPAERRIQSARLLMSEAGAGASETEKVRCLESIAETIKQCSPKDQLALASFLVSADKLVTTQGGMNPCEVGLLTMQELAFGSESMEGAQRAIKELPAAQKAALMNATVRNWKRELKAIDEKKAELLGSKFAQEPVYKEYMKSLGQEGASFDHPSLKPNMKQCAKHMDAVVKVFESAKDDPAAQRVLLEAYVTARTIEGMNENNPSMKSLTVAVGEIAKQKFDDTWPADQQKRQIVAALLTAPIGVEERLEIASMVLDTVEKSDPLWVAAASTLINLQSSGADSQTRAKAKARVDLLAKK